MFDLLIPVFIFVLIAIAIQVALLALGTWRTRAQRKLVRARGKLVRAWQTRLQTLPVDEARSIAEGLLAEPDLFAFMPIAADWLDRFRTLVPATVFDLWSRFGAPHTVSGPRARVAPHVYQLMPEADEWILLYCKGRPGGKLALVGYRGSEAVLIASPERETIYEIYDWSIVGGTWGASELVEYPTIYHWIVSLGPANLHSGILLRPAESKSEMLVRPAGGQSRPEDLLRPDE